MESSGVVQGFGVFQGVGKAPDELLGLGDTERVRGLASAVSHRDH